MAIESLLPNFFVGYETQLESLIFYTVVIALYALVVATLYQRLSKKNIFEMPSHPGLSDDILWLIKYLLAFPAGTFLFFSFLASFIMLLSEGHTINQILILSMTIVAATRLTAYINEGAAVDLAKLIPLALLGVFIVNPQFFVLDIPVDKFLEALTRTDLILRYFIFVIGLEFGLRILYLGALAVGIAERPEEEAEED